MPGGLWGWVCRLPISTFKIGYNAFPTGIISGLLSCLVLSVVYSDIMSRKQWRDPSGLVVAYGGLAGALSGTITSAVYAADQFGSSVSSGMVDVIALTVFVILIGIIAGVITGLFFSSIIWVILTKNTRNL